ncbi:MAG TPA: substrate-binding domain-containing protein [Terriglobales bacterium]|nr:substrate-binding domain-containing protein [Terriglobales bacterium]
MSSKRNLCLLLLPVFLMVFCISCGQHSGDEHYYLVTVNTQIPYWQAAAAGFFKAASEMKVRAEIAGPDTYDAKAQQDEFRRILTKKPSGILISPADPQFMKADIDGAIAAGIPVLTIDSDSPASKRLVFIGTNNYQAGILGGEIAAKQLQGKGTVIVFTMPNQTNLEDRLRGYRQVFEKYPQLKIARVVDIKGDPRVAFDETQKVIDSKEKIDGFLCLEALAGKEVATVLNNTKTTGRTVIAMDTDDATLDWVKKGVIAATIAQRPYTMGYFGMRMLDDLHHAYPTLPSVSGSTTSPLPAFVDTGAILIDRSNVDGVIQAQAATKTK